VAKADEQDKIILRISECEQVVNNLENTPAWQVVHNDMVEGEKQLNDNWQNIWDEKQMLAAKVLKFAYQHILELKGKYKEELMALKKELSIIENPNKIIRKDYDSK